MKTPHPSDSLKASLSPPVGGLLHSFRRNWQTTNAQTFLPIVTFYHSSPIQINQSLPDSLRIQSPSRSSCGLFYQECNRKGRNVKSLRFYSRLCLVPKPHQRWRPVIDLSRLNTFLLVERFKMETPESIRASDSKGMGVVDRSISHHLYISFHQSPKKYLTLSLGWIINQEKSKLKPI